MISGCGTTVIIWCRGIVPRTRHVDLVGRYEIDIVHFGLQLHAFESRFFMGLGKK